MADVAIEQINDNN
jgi:HSP90 family molecular chaperone